MAAPGTRAPIFYGWVVVSVTALVLLITAGTRITPGAFLLDMEADTGWSKGILSLAAAVGLVVFGLAGPISGVFMGRYGVRRVTMASLLITAAAMGIASQVTEAWQLAFFFGLMSGLGTGLVASVLAATVGTRWFVERRGIVLGSSGRAEAPASSSSSRS